MSKINIMKNKLLTNQGGNFGAEKYNNKLKKS